jgi:hypothetical protein
VDPISNRQAAQPSFRPGRTRPGGRLRHDVQWARAAHPTASFVACGVFALTVLTLVGLWTRGGAGPALDSSNMVPSSVIAALAVVAVASTYRLEHRRRPAVVRRDDLVSPVYSVSAMARANAAHMAGVSHIRILECDAVDKASATGTALAVVARAPSFATGDALYDRAALPLDDRRFERTAS